ncbi:venom protease-like [Amblyomma americanum]
MSGEKLFLGLFIACSCSISAVHNWINEPSCGLSKPHSRVFNGKPARRMQVPWIVNWYSFLRYDPGEMFMSPCGGSIISRTFVLTAAHCFHDCIPVKKLVVLVFYNSTTRTRGPWTTAKKIIIHPNYVGTTLENDIALMELSTSLDFDQFVAPVCLPKSQWKAAGQRLFVAGWGATDEEGKGPVSDVLLYTILRAAPRKVCEPCMEEDYVKKSTVICSYSNSTQPQPGDSGGPAMVLKRNGRSVQVGVQSWIGRCQDYHYNSGFTKVSLYIPWIESIVTPYEANK